MACSEITQAFAWVQQKNSESFFPARAFFTKHIGSVSPNPSKSANPDYCYYAVGYVDYQSNPTANLFGVLDVYINTLMTGSIAYGMQSKPTTKIHLNIFPDGTVWYQQNLNGNPVGGLPPTKLATTCIQGLLLTGINGDEVITVGVSREPSKPIIK